VLTPVTVQLHRRISISSTRGSYCQFRLGFSKKC
jgi:hypothetical protein